jgi:mannitol operon transcriptional antiterminator
MNKRKDKILTSLKEKHELDLNALSRAFGVSARTIRNDIQALNQLVKGPNAVGIVSGKVMVTSQENFSWLLRNTIDQSNYYQYRLSAEERRAIVALILLCSEGYVTTLSVADKLSVSKSTIVGELKSIKGLLADCSLELHAKTRLGFRVAGAEGAIRDAILKFSLTADSTADASDAYRFLAGYELEGKVERSRIRSAIIEWERKNNLELTDDSFSKVENYLVLISNRLLNAHTLEQTAGYLRGYAVLAADLLGRVREMLDFSQQVSGAEIAALSDLLSDCRYIKPLDCEDNSTVYVQMQISAFISDVCRQLEVDQQISFKKYYSILVHIDSTIRNIRGGHSQMKNPLRKELEAAYPHIFETIRYEVGTLNRLVGKELGSDEISFIAMYIIAVVEEIRRPSRHIRAILVCSAGMCTALLLQSKLLQHFDIEIVEIVSLHKLSCYDLTGIDLVISTVWIEPVACPAACISPLLNDSDMDILRSAIGNESMSLAIQHQSRGALLQKVCGYIVEYQQIIERTWNVAESQRRQEIEQFYYKYFSQAKATDTEKHPYELLSLDRIELDLVAADWRSAIRKTGEFLLRCGDIEPSYIDHMIQNVEESGPYIVFIPHVAIAHSAANHGTNRLSIAIARLREGVPFGHETNDPVHIVVCISVGRERDHLFPVFQLIKLFQNQAVLDYLLNVNEKQQVIDIIKLYELQKGLREHENT